VIAWLRDVALLAIAITIFLSGRYMGRGEIQVQWDAQKVQHAEQIARQARDYAAQLSAAQTQALADRVELERIRALPHPGKLYVRTTAKPTVLPTFQAPTCIAGSGPLPQETGRDITDRIYAEIADNADDTVAACRAALAIWPR